MNYDKFIEPFRGIDASNWILALTVAAISFVLIHGVVILFRRRLDKLSENGRADRPAAELLKATLARTSNFAVFVTSALIGVPGTLAVVPSAGPPQYRRIVRTGMGGYSSGSGCHRP